LGGWVGAVLKLKDWSPADVAGLKLKVSVGGKLKLKACPCGAVNGGTLKLKGWGGELASGGSAGGELKLKLAAWAG
jgi:hypothetical protein